MWGLRGQAAQSLAVWGQDGALGFQGGPTVSPGAPMHPPGSALVPVPSPCPLLAPNPAAGWRRLRHHPRALTREETRTGLRHKPQPLLRTKTRHPGGRKLQGKAPSCAAAAWEGPNPAASRACGTPAVARSCCTSTCTRSLRTQHQTKALDAAPATRAVPYQQEGLEEEAQPLRVLMSGTEADASPKTS